MLASSTENFYHPTSCVDLYCASGSLVSKRAVNTHNYFPVLLSFHMFDNVIKITLRDYSENERK